MDFLKAVQSGDSTRVEEFLRSGVDVNAPDRFDRNAIHLASVLMSTDVLKLLLAHGADANLSDRTGQTALMLASKSDRVDAVAVLIEAGADLGATDGNGHSVLWHSKHCEMHFVLPFRTGLHGTLFVRRLRRTRSTDLINAALRTRTRMSPRA